MRRRFTNASIKWRGNTKVMSVRVPAPIVEVIEAAVGKPDLPNQGAVLQDALALWAMLEQRADAS